MKKTLQECKEIVAKEWGWNDFSLAVGYASNTDLIELTDLANKMYYEQSEKETKNYIKSCPCDVLELLRIIAGSDDPMYREEAKRLIRRYCNTLPNPPQK